LFGLCIKLYDKTLEESFFGINMSNTVEQHNVQQVAVSAFQDWEKAA